MQTVEARALLDKFNSVRVNAPTCAKIYCGTCGGSAAVILKDREALHYEVALVLSRMSLEEFVEFGEWMRLLEEINSDAVADVYLRAGKMINPSDIRALDRYLFQASKLNCLETELAVLYEAHLKSGISNALETRDSSLVETLILILGEDILNNDELFSLALSKKPDPKIARALYNKLRHILPEVRGYKAGESLSGDDA